MRCARGLIAVAALLALDGCAQEACVLPGQTPMLMVTLYFGRDITGRAPVSDTEWSRFAADEIGRRFPDGFTSFDGAGQWRNPASGQVVREPSKIVEIVTAASADVKADLAAVMTAYRRQFHQLAVGAVSSQVCAAF